MTEDDLAADLIQAAEDQHMDALVEVHDEDELQRALALGAVLIGVNARDLRTLEIDRDQQARLLRLVPIGFLKVAESGIESAAHAAGVLAAGADALLVGTALMRRPELLETLVRGVG
jgi:indole-3-glycerol phosphate synthase